MIISKDDHVSPCKLYASSVLKKVSLHSTNEGAFMPKVTFITPNEEKVELDAPEGLSLLEIAHMHSVDLEGACEGSLACSTCHVIVDPSWFDKLDGATEDEEDMLDLAFGLTHTSRLGCQIIMTPELDGLVVRLPDGTRNMLLD